MGIFKQSYYGMLKLAAPVKLPATAKPQQSMGGAPAAAPTSEFRSVPNVSLSLSRGPITDHDMGWGIPQFNDALSTKATTTPGSATPQEPIKPAAPVTPAAPPPPPTTPPTTPSAPAAASAPSPVAAATTTPTAPGVPDAPAEPAAAVDMPTNTPGNSGLETIESRAGNPDSDPRIASLYAEESPTALPESTEAVTQHAAPASAPASADSAAVSAQTTQQHGATPDFYYPDGSPKGPIQTGTEQADPLSDPQNLPDDPSAANPAMQGVPSRRKKSQTWVVQPSTKGPDATYKSLGGSLYTAEDALRKGDMERFNSTMASLNAEQNVHPKYQERLRDLQQRQQQLKDAPKPAPASQPKDTDEVSTAKAYYEYTRQNKGEEAAEALRRRYAAVGIDIGSGIPALATPAAVPEAAKAQTGTTQAPGATAAQPAQANPSVLKPMPTPTYQQANATRQQPAKPPQRPAAAASMRINAKDPGVNRAIGRILPGGFTPANYRTARLRTRQLLVQAEQARATGDMETYNAIGQFLNAAWKGRNTGQYRKPLAAFANGGRVFGQATRSSRYGY